MKYSERWLREWVNPDISINALCDLLTMAGLEVESITPLGDFSNVLIGKVVACEKHPNAERLHVCNVDVGQPDLLQIVCGAQNVKADMKVAVAMVGASINNQTIKAAKLRGIQSAGMLCSAKELGMAEESEGILALPEDAPMGEDLRAYLSLNDNVIELGITPNRGDCLSIQGLARDISALTNSPYQPLDVGSIAETISEKLSVSVEEPSLCPRYVGRVIRDVNPQALTPLWMQERLRRSGIKRISAIVDVTNYVMLELGQPMHAFDLDKIIKGIVVRKSQTGEKIELLDGSSHTLNDDTLVIADQHNPLAIAGVMGGIESGVTSQTQHIFLESAFFTQQQVIKQRQHYQLNSDSAYRFERGVDPQLQQKAIERATQLILEIAGGKAGPIVEQVNQVALPELAEITLTQEKLNAVLGFAITKEKVNEIFTALQFKFTQEGDVWTVLAPSYRFDMLIPEDLIEEVARLYGYDNIPTVNLRALVNAVSSDDELDLYALRDALNHAGYHEVITYSFIDEASQRLLDPECSPLSLINPLSADMGVMRTSLLPGMLKALDYNQNRQQSRVRLFEVGNCFATKYGKHDGPYVAGVIAGNPLPEQWAEKSRAIDFYDLKGDVEGVLSTILPPGVEFSFKPQAHPALHPGQAASIFIENTCVGMLGALHPKVLKSLDLTGPVFIFEINLSLVKNRPRLPYQEISKFPEIRRDLALIVNQSVPAEEIQATIKLIVGDWLKEVFIFDVYQGKGISPGQKSIAVGLILQHPSRTLIDEEVSTLLTQVVEALNKQLGANLRS